MQFDLLFQKLSYGYVKWFEIQKASLFSWSQKYVKASCYFFIVVYEHITKIVLC